MLERKRPRMGTGIVEIMERRLGRSGVPFSFAPPLMELIPKRPFEHKHQDEHNDQREKVYRRSSFREEVIQLRPWKESQLFTRARIRSKHSLQ
jgi:hypothetical protein